ncbi:iron chelate uptake ABC transporter family permease subunit [Dechloromonas sp. TW-R-39-2]|uniref:FecCD family ABC transporter permease n=1 Tax=Dechloromonas TaxID=73029 RepID=UPI00193DE3E0|nr:MULTISPECIES: iron ABC transporter permease [Dechloromonas]QRM18076.1 iron chelate uptake ABC transporter family permease subunit [Dechloromonas sp. TW-R-39-2]UCV11529.1 iron ABC transporter permease [Dechloromonas denitrificans]
MPSSRRALLILACLCLLVLASFALALTVGSFKVSIGEVWAALLGQEGGAGDVVLQLRLPRAIAGFACGGLLALAGALMQVLLRNPLADPYVLGISGGAGAGAMFAIILGLPALGIDGLAFAGALGAMLLVFGLAHGDGSWTQTRLLLTGVIVAAGCGALVALMLAIAPEHKLRGMLFWLMGDLGQSAQWWPALSALGLALILAMPFARELNMLARGQMQAQALGVAVDRLRYAIYLLASLATAASVTTAGSIGFVGLIVPHLVRLATGNDQRLLLPASVLAGGSLLVLADTLARTIIAPQQLPVGVLTALIGVPIFLVILSRQPK